MEIEDYLGQTVTVGYEARNGITMYHSGSLVSVGMIKIRVQGKRETFTIRKEHLKSIRRMDK